LSVLRLHVEIFVEAFPNAENALPQWDAEYEYYLGGRLLEGECRVRLDKNRKSVA
jgi:hypothetical protein